MVKAVFEHAIKDKQAIQLHCESVSNSVITGFGILCSFVVLCISIVSFRVASNDYYNKTRAVPTNLAYVDLPH